MHLSSVSAREPSCSPALLLLSVGKFPDRKLWPRFGVRGALEQRTDLRGAFPAKQRGLVCRSSSGHSQSGLRHGKNCNVRPPFNAKDLVLAK